MSSEQSKDDIVSIFDDPPQRLENESVTGLNCNVLIYALMKEYGLTVTRDRQGEGEPEPVDGTSTPTDRLSVVRGFRHSNLERWGPRFTLKKANYSVGRLQIGVFADPNAAAQVFVEQITYTSMGPNKKLGPELGDQAVGWWLESQQGFQRILFRRDNVVVSIGMDYGGDRKITVPTETTLELANQLDLALKTGSHGVSRGTTLRIPRIVRIETPAIVSERTSVSAQVRIAVPENPQDKSGREVERVQTITLRVPGVNPEDRAKPEQKTLYQFTYITAGCVVVTAETSVNVRAVE